jgi:hypothetical protein
MVRSHFIYGQSNVVMFRHRLKAQPHVLRPSTTSSLIYPEHGVIADASYIELFRSSRVLVKLYMNAMIDRLNLYKVAVLGDAGVGKCALTMQIPYKFLLEIKDLKLQG